MTAVKALLPSQISVAHKFSSTDDLENFVTKELYVELEPLFTDEIQFLEQLSDVLRRSVSGEVLSDSQKHIFSVDQPFDAEIENEIDLELNNSGEGDDDEENLSASSAPNTVSIENMICSYSEQNLLRDSFIKESKLCKKPLPV